MGNAIEDLIGIALDGERNTHHELLPEGFGLDMGRWTLLHGCLELLAARFPHLCMELSGSLDALRKFGLTPGRTLPIGATSIPVRFGRTDRLGALRLQFSRALIIGRPAGHASARAESP